MPGNVEERILAISRKHPEYGARRILTLLKQEEIFVSASTIYRVLKRNGLGTRAKRIAKFGKEHTKGLELATRKPPIQITSELEEQIVTASLQHPDFGSKRLVSLLKENEISVSEATIYKIQKRYGIQTRYLRRFKREQLKLLEIHIAKEAPESDAADVFEKETPSLSAPLTKASPRKSYWPFHLLNLLLLILVGFLGYQAVQNFLKGEEQHRPVSLAAPAPVYDVPKRETANRPLQDYLNIWERNLFNTLKENPSEVENKMSLENLAVAKKDIGLKLVGTIVADNAALRRAVIDNQKTGEQNAYFEGDQASIFRIKKILRNNVIISSEKGDALLTIKPEDFVKVSNESISEQDASMRSSSTDQTSKEKTTTIRRREKRLAREDVISSLENLDELMQNVKFTPYTRNNQLKGLRITGITPDSILRKMGAAQ